MAAEHAEALGKAWAQVCADERVETAAQVLHNRRHPLGTSSSCGRCVADARAVAAVFLRENTVIDEEGAARLVAGLLDLCDSLDNELVDYDEVPERIRAVLEREGLT